MNLSVRCQSFLISFPIVVLFLSFYISSTFIYWIVHNWIENWWVEWWWMEKVMCMWSSSSVVLLKHFNLCLLCMSFAFSFSHSIKFFCFFFASIVSCFVCRCKNEHREWCEYNKNEKWHIICIKIGDAHDEFFFIP